ncbi:hypothetical protein B5G10_07390 [Barnesiella sp. An55]|nr:hypothetical protein B5G10_07390 [Barnesiella sp. An55]
MIISKNNGKIESKNPILIFFTHSQLQIKSHPNSLFNNHLQPIQHKKYLKKYIIKHIFLFVYLQKKVVLCVNNLKQSFLP